MYHTNREVRKWTKILLAKVEDGLLDKDQVISAFCNYLSEADVYEMMHANEFIWDDEDDNE